VGRMTGDVGNGAVERLRVLALLFKHISILVKETVGVVKACLLEAEVVVSLGDTVHMAGIDGKVETDRVSVNSRSRFGLFLVLSLLGGSCLLFGGSLLGSIVGVVVNEMGLSAHGVR